MREDQMGRPVCTGRRGRWHFGTMGGALGLALLLAACSGPNRQQDVSSVSGFQLFVTASPNAIPAAQGEEAQGGTTIIMVKVYDSYGRLVDGAIVTLSATLGRFPGTEPGEEFVAVQVTTVNGVASRPLSAKSTKGTDIVTAVVEDAVATVNVTIF